MCVFILLCGRALSAAVSSVADLCYISALRALGGLNMLTHFSGVWNVVFNLPIPGWLPASNSIGTEATGTSYALYATAKYSAVEEEAPTSSWSFLSLCAPFRCRMRTAEAQRSITIARFIAAPKAEIPEPTVLNYLVNSTATAVSKDSKGKARIPPDVLAQIQVLASVPEYVDVNDSALALTLRLRSKDLCEEECKKLQITEVDIDIIQHEKCRYASSLTPLDDDMGLTSIGVDTVLRPHASHASPSHQRKYNRRTCRCATRTR